MTDGGATRQGVWIVAAPEETDLVLGLIEPLQTAGYEVRHQEGVLVGDSIVGAATDAVARGLPIILCATRLSVGSSWTYQILNATRADGRPRVFVVQMSGDTYVGHLSLQTQVARFDLDPGRAVEDLLTALRRYYPAAPPPPASTPAAASLSLCPLDEPTGLGADHVDLDALQRFRERLRPERAVEYPPSLGPWEWLAAGQLWRDGSLTRAGALLFGVRPTVTSMTGIVKCVRYHGDDRSARREFLTLSRGIPDQIRDARAFVADRVRRGESTSPDQVEAAAAYEYPMVAVREIVANALVHRDHADADREIHVRLFGNRLEVSSPGGWPGHKLETGVTYLLEDLQGQSVKRNSWLAYVLSWASLFEGLGGGIPTAVAECVSVGCKPPTVVLDEHGFVTVTLTKAAWSVRLASPVHQLTWPVRVGALPPLAGDRQDRDADRALREFMERTSRAAMVVSGMGGVGKTQLAAEVARQANQDQGVDLTVWANASSRLGILEAFASAAEKVTGVVGVDAEQAAVRFLEWLATTHQRWLVVLDDLEDPADLRGLWPPAHPQGRTLVTTRRRDAALMAAGRTVLQLGVLTTAESLQYLTARLGHDERMLSGAAELADDLGHLPLALAQASAYMLDRAMDCATYRQRLAARPMADLSPDSLPDEQASRFSQTWTLSIELADGLAPRGLARPMFDFLSVLDANSVPLPVLTTPAARDYLASRRDETSVTGDDALDALHSLNRLSLLTLSMTARTVATHRLVQRAAREILDPDERERVTMAAADALLEVWPEVEVSGTPNQELRANAAALRAQARPDSALFVHNVVRRLGRSLGEAGQIESAWEIFDRRWNEARQRLGEDDPVTLVARADCAAWVGRAGQPAEAVDQYEAIVRDMERVLGPDHHLTLTARRNLASWRSLAGDPDEALDDNLRLLDDMARVVGVDHPHALAVRHNLAAAYAALGRHAEAFAINEALLVDETRVLGPDHPDVLSTRANSSAFLGELGDPAAAATAYEEVSAHLTDLLGPDHPDTLAARANLATWHGKSEGPGRALSELGELMGDLVRLLGPDHPSTLAARAELAGWQGQAGKVTEAAASYESLLADMDRILGPANADRMAVRAALNDLMARAPEAPPISEPSVVIHNGHGFQIGSYNTQHNTFG